MRYEVWDIEKNARTLSLRRFERPAREVAGGERWKEVELKSSEVLEYPYNEETRV